MSLHQELPVYKSCYDLLLEIFTFTKEFKKEYKYTVGEIEAKKAIQLGSFFYYYKIMQIDLFSFLEEETEDLIEAIFRAYYEC